ncbi:MAG: NAD-dependent epimerase/dehydratase family protein [FCB group bacterium]|nr:NAD-dependent epimerase/dehydratase family protein [FCB group bacterium]
MAYKRILVTGGSGLLGTGLKQIVNEFPGREFFFVSSIDCDLTQADQTNSLINAFQPDAIMQYAAKSGGIAYSQKFPATLLRDNILMNLNILDSALKLGVKKVVLSLSVGMYPQKAPIPLKEEYIHDGMPHSNNASYAFAKRLLDPAVRAYRRQYGMNVIGFVPNGIFGENMNYRYDESIMLAALIRRFYEKKDTQDRLEVWGDGTPLREYTYSRDMARASMWCLDHYDEEQFLNIGTNEERSIKEIAEQISSLLEIDQARLYFNTDKPNGIHRRNTDNSRFLSISKFDYTPFKTGLKNTINWFIDHYHSKNGIRL